MNSSTSGNGEAVDFSADVPLIMDLKKRLDDPWTIIHGWLGDNSGKEYKFCVGTLSTIDDNDLISSRTMNVRFSGNTMSLATHRGSRKWSGKNVLESASWHVYWPKLRRQLNIRGMLREASALKAQEWWMERPANMDIVSALSEQSKEASTEKIEYLRSRAAEYYAMENVQKLPCPESFVVLMFEPTEIEFWEGDFDRVHHRYLYLKSNDSASEWTRKVLQP
ncbi:Pyridoxamine 5'-phosphate oxidase [Corynebacterium mustelae]|uniref:Pyridoxamine 5'-phosphate oxidase n=1 Tax=Corynebacterium mustelae TaxID=571915 RepID=A0A0G3H1C8_9CORY|nr:pyridoxine 5'-phosphate oxidase C-terminal domain-containing protein [Corynebacterium mustelae]AKK07196.1 Pyridoxamine 5'-phosphate oxidase [Corynebacterium mustelae]